MVDGSNLLNSFYTCQKTSVMVSGLCPHVPKLSAEGVEDFAGAPSVSHSQVSCRLAKGQTSWPYEYTDNAIPKGGKFIVFHKAGFKLVRFRFKSRRDSGAEMKQDNSANRRLILPPAISWISTSQGAENPAATKAYRYGRLQ